VRLTKTSKKDSLCWGQSFGPGVSQIQVKSVTAGDASWWSEWWFSKTPWSHRYKYWCSNPDPLQHNVLNQNSVLRVLHGRKHVQVFQVCSTLKSFGRETQGRHLISFSLMAGLYNLFFLRYAIANAKPSIPSVLLQRNARCVEMCTPYLCVPIP
jgi:hypothetical protein